MESRRGKRGAFTLVELLVVVVVVLVLTAIAYPIVTLSRNSANRATAILNLRECGVALSLYMEDGDPSTLPSRENARWVLEGVPTWDPGDTWRKSREEEFGAPFVGSFAYVREVAMLQREGEDEGLWKASNPILMISPFYASPSLPAFRGDVPPEGLCPDGCPFPEGLLGVRLDGSLRRLQPPKSSPASGQILFDWPRAFLSDAEGEVVEIDSTAPR
ncbi:MAG: prepilin-type N-terminal cleavage/methylation domain-containing protein [Proteobacteria bacterium]|nr:MAG: prepilin-type N-terminal cleavage/methylation domain-containing protein [Pseudomonadota bacterium]